MDNNCFEKNMNCLKDKRKQLYDKLVEIIDNKEYDFSRFNLIETKNGQKTVEIIDNGKKFRLNSIYNPQIEAKKWADSFEFNNLDTPVIMFGLANGIFARAILNRMNKDSFAIIVEPDISLFIYCLYEFDMCDIFSNLDVVILIEQINFDKLKDALNKNIDVKLINIQIVCTHPKMDILYRDKCKIFVGKIRERITKSIGDLYTYMILSDAILDNLFKNFCYIKGSNCVADMIGVIPEDIPFIITAAGPSLDKNVDELKKAEGKAFIMATDRSVGTLVKHNINFDAIITLDASKTIDFLGDEPGKFSNYPLFAGIDSNNEILKNSRARKIWTITSDFWLSLCDKHKLNTTVYSIGGSVATAAFNVARLIGSKIIVLVGQDLAYDGEVSHTGNIKEKIKYNAYSGLIEGIHGEKLKTRADWVKFRDWFEKSIEEIGEDVEVIDATEGGAKIQGTTILTLRETIEKYCIKEFDFKKVIDNLIPTFTGNFYLEFKQDIIHLENELYVVKRCAEKGILASDDMFAMCENKDRNIEKERACSSIIKEMSKLIEEQLIYKIIEQYIAKNINLIMRGVNILTDDEEENIKDTCRISKFVYQRILDAIDDIEPKLIDAIKDID